MAYNKIITSEGNVQFQTVEGKIINVHPFHVYSLFNEDTVSFLLIAMPKSSGLAVFTSKAEDLEVNGVVYTFEELPDALAEAFAIAGAQARAEIVDELPETGMTNTIYLVPKPSGQTGFDEYIYLKDEGRWELIGDTSIEFDQYVQKTDFSAFTASTEAKINYLSGAVDTEVARAISAETALQTAIDNEVSARTEDVNALSGAIDTEIAAREAADSVISGAVDNVSADLANEVSRALSAETDLQTAIDNEVSARTEADGALQVEIDDLEGEIEILQVALADEVSARTDADTALDNKITYVSGAVDTEVTRATSAETELQTSIGNEVSARENADIYISGAVDTLSSLKADKANAVASAEYVSSSTTIDLKNISGEVISQVDASDFIIDGMVQDVRIENGYLVIDFNTASGIEDIEIPLTDIFNPNDYYNKTAIDGIVSGINEDIAEVSSALTEDERVWGEALNDLNSRINTISGNALTSGDVQTQIDESISGKTIDYLSAGTAIDLTNNVISFTLPISAGTGSKSIIQGQGTKATATNSHAEGYFTIASGSYSHAEGSNTSATTSGAHAEGTTTKAIGEGSHAEGIQTVANGDFSHAEGLHTVTYNKGEHASGRYNISSSASTIVGDSGNTLFTVGNGTNTRHNAFEIRESGDIYIADTNASGEFYEKPMIKLQDALSSGITSGDVQTQIDESISGKVNTTDFNTYSGNVETAINAKADPYSAGTNIDITNNVISVTGITIEASSAITSGDTNPVQGGVLYDKFDEIEQVTARAMVDFAEADEVTARALVDLNDRFGGLKLIKITQSAYDALTTKDENSLYIIVN